jgi:hypothetical protein
MRFIEDIRDVRWMLGIVLFLSIVICAAPVGLSVASAVGDDWLDAMVQAVLIEQTKDGIEVGRFSPYVAQLAMVRTHLLNGEGEGVYRTMNRFMEMLQAREAGISQEAADRLFDYCYVVTPARYHDVSRHLHRLSGHQAGAPSA